MAPRPSGQASTHARTSGRQSRRRVSQPAGLHLVDADRQHYQRLPSVKEVLLVSHREPHLVVYRRGEAGGWTSHEARAGGTIDLASVGARLAVDDVYRDGIEDADTEAR
jgi:Uma2 family endonuclease